MKKKLLTCGLLLGMSFASNASLLTVSGGNVFEDRGITTVDTQTGLEWLDVTATTGRSFFDVEQDIQSNGGVFDADVWRYATARDMELLGLNWFGMDISETVFAFLSEPDQLLLESFLATFGDTLISYLDLIGYEEITFDSEGGGFTLGLIDSTELYPDSPDPTRSAALFLHDEYTEVSDGYRYNGPDLLAAQSEVYDASIGYDDIGSFLVRDASSASAFRTAVAVSEPSTIAIMASALFGMVLFGRRKKKS